MLYIVYTTEDPVSEGIAEALIHIAGFEDAGSAIGSRLLSSKALGARMLELNASLLEAERLDNLGADALILLSKHSSSKSIPSLTVHPTGNWSDKAELGGKPKELSMAAPLYMRAVLRALSIFNNDKAMIVTYEATHHGPLLMTPSMFVEIEEHSYTHKNAETVAMAIVDALQKVEKLQVAIGIGSIHYPQKFTALALGGRYAFSHMMPKYYVDNVDMIEEAAARSDPKADLAVIDWKSISAAQRKQVIGELEKIGLKYERI
ncbi:MAG: D-aminoacyl-tRNA deacylase [Candidatus Micrarchaeaceae archaeon]